MKKILIILIIAAVAFVAKNELGKKKFSEKFLSEFQLFSSIMEWKERACQC